PTGAFYEPLPRWASKGAANGARSCNADVPPMPRVQPLELEDSSRAAPRSGCRRRRNLLRRKHLLHTDTPAYNVRIAGHRARLRHRYTSVSKECGGTTM